MIRFTREFTREGPKGYQYKYLGTYHNGSLNKFNLISIFKRFVPGLGCK